MSSGLQGDYCLVPNWFTLMQPEKLEECKENLKEAEDLLCHYIDTTTKLKVEEMWDLIEDGKDRVETELISKPLKLTGVKYDKICRNCRNKLPDKGTGSRKCSQCGDIWRGIEEEPTKKISDKEKIKKDEKNLARRIKFFQPYMKVGCEPKLENVAHNHSIIPLHVQLPAMKGSMFLFAMLSFYIFVYYVICLKGPNDFSFNQPTPSYI